MASRKSKSRESGYKGDSSHVEGIPRELLLSLLQRGEVRSVTLLPTGSNYTFLINLEGDAGSSCQAIYKPRAGERPLWDFPRGSLYKREYATYLASRELGWPLVPPTVVREGPHGIGSVQLYIDPMPDANYFTLYESHVDEFRRIALFDCLVNNADRKAGHCLMDRDGRIWTIDHGLAFHPDFKMRTVIWDFCGEPIPEDLLEDLESFLSSLSSKDGNTKELKAHLSDEEVDALEKRGQLLLDSPVFPDLNPHHNIPWPWL